MKRRDFLVNSTVAGLTLSGIVDTLLRARLSSVWAAQNAGSNARKFIQFHFQGAPPAHYFYLPPDSNSSDTIVHNASLKNQFRNGQPVWESRVLRAAGKTIRLPTLWNENIPTRNNSFASISDMLSNHLFFRGINMKVDSHLACVKLIQRPDPGSRSIAGILADEALPTKILFPSFMGNYAGLESFKAAQASNYVVKNIGNGKFGSKNDLVRTDILSAFIPNSKMQKSLSRRGLVQQAFDSTVRHLQEKHRNINPDLEKLHLTSESVESLIYQDLSSLADEWPSLRQKYQLLIERAANLDTILTERINPSNFETNWSRSDNSQNYFIHQDIRNILMRNSDANTSVYVMAESFALAEFLVRHNLAAAMSLSIGGFYFMNAVTNDQPNGEARDQVLDMHHFGVLPSIPMMTFYYRAFAACLYELRASLIAINEFENTVICYGGEFARSMRDNGSGSDHGWNAYAFSMMSGAIKQPSVIGNIYRDNPDSYARSVGYQGTWGIAAPIDGLEHGQTVPGPGHAASSIATALRIDSPTPNFSPLIQETSDGLTPIYEDGKIVEVE